jgi:hypothetical protein
MIRSLALCVLFAVLPAICCADDAGGPHAMDFDLGCWKTHSSRLMHPLSGSSEWRDMDGYTVVKPIWNGRANIAEYKGAGPAGEVELLALRTYDPTTNQWYLNFSHPSSGKLDVPGVGVANNGRIDFYDQETLNGKAIWVRFSIWGISPDTAQSEQAFSVDAGKTWELNWVNHYTRVRTIGGQMANAVSPLQCGLL